MKKLLNISVIAALAILPLAANAAPMTEVEISNPQDTQTVATTGYVKGAYNALVAGKQDKLSADQLQAIQNVSGLDNRLTTAENDIDALETASATHATKTGVTDTITASTVTVPALLQWGDTTPQTVEANIVGATYAE